MHVRRGPGYVICVYVWCVEGYDGVDTWGV